MSNDIALRYLGTVSQVAAKLPEAVAWLIKFLENVLKLVVSRGAAGKSVYLGSCESVRAALRAPMLQLHVTESWSTRWLGIDYFGGGVPKRNVVRRARQANAKHRWVKIASLKKKRVKVRAVVTQGLRASLAYGAKCNGTPGPILRFLRAKLAATRVGEKRCGYDRLGAAACLGRRRVGASRMGEGHGGCMAEAGAAPQAGMGRRRRLC